MATSKAKSAAKSSRRSAASKRAASRKAVGRDLGKLMDDIKIGTFSLDDVLQGTSKNLEAVADANRAIIDGYSDIAKRQYEMLKELLDELRKVAGSRDDVVKKLKHVVDQARKDVQALQKMASKTNSQAQRIVKKRTDANIRAWKKLIAEARKAAGGRKAAVKKAAVKQKVAAKKKAATVKKKVAKAKKKAAVKKKVAVARKKVATARKKAAVKKKVATARKKVAVKKKVARRKVAVAKKKAVAMTEAAVQG